MERTTIDLLQGTLGVLILKSVSRAPLHGYGIARWIEQVTGDEVLIEDGSLYPALHRLQAMRLLTSEWGRVRERPPRQALHHHRAGTGAAARRNQPLAALLVRGVAPGAGETARVPTRAAPWPSEIARDVDEEIAAHLERAARRVRRAGAVARRGRRSGRGEEVRQPRRCRGGVPADRSPVSATGKADAAC